jgi:hypothetical protein
MPMTRDYFPEASLRMTRFMENYNVTSGIRVRLSDSRFSIHSTVELRYRQTVRSIIEPGHFSGVKFERYSQILSPGSDSTT